MTSLALLDAPVYGLAQAAKGPRLLEELNQLTDLHRERCAPYARLLGATRAQRPAASLEELPWIPVALFKSHRLVSVRDADVVQTLTSSGTTGQSPSRILLDRETAELQSKALVRIMSELLGPRRLPMLVVDSEGIFRERAAFSARAAGVLGMMKFGAQPTFLLDDAMRPDLAALRRFVDRFGGRPSLVFGFTFMIWKYLWEPARSLGIDLSNATLVHSGGWKKLIEEAVDAPTFKARLRDAFGLVRVHDFYGMVEQVGSVFVEGSDGLLRPPAFADVIVRDPRTWEPAKLGEPGVLQVLSALPRSYPGHSLLTEDLGVIEAIDACGYGGKAFRALGRAPRSELRGCSDTHAYAVGGQAP